MKKTTSVRKALLKGVYSGVLLGAMGMTAAPAVAVMSASSGPRSGEMSGGQIRRHPGASQCMYAQVDREVEQQRGRIVDSSTTGSAQSAAMPVERLVPPGDRTPGSAQ